METCVSMKSEHTVGLSGFSLGGDLTATRRVGPDWNQYFRILLSILLIFQTTYCVASLNSVH